MTRAEFNFYEQEVVDYVNTLLDKVRDTNFTEYVLLLARAGYQKENEKTGLSPYVIQSNLEILQDISREKFFHTYMSQYTSVLEENVSMTQEIQEFNLNLQLMIYSHVWESHLFIKSLIRIASILNGNGYRWKISFERTRKKGCDDMIPMSKGKLIKEEILDPLCACDEETGKLLCSLYDSTIRNEFAHSLYLIDMDRCVIIFLKSETFSKEKEVDFFEWEQTFCYSVLFSYHLTKSLVDRLNSFIDDYPETTKGIEISWPSYRHPEEFHKKSIYPILRDNKGMKYVEFSFTQM